MLWIWLLALITLGLLVWFGYQVFSGGVSPKTKSLSGDSSGGAGSHNQGAVSSDGNAAAGSASAAGSVSSAGFVAPSDSASSAGSVSSSGSASSAGSVSPSGSASSAGSVSPSGSASSAGSASSSGSASSARMGAVAAAGATAVAAGGIVAARASSRPGSGPNATNEPIVYDNVASGAEIAAAGSGKTGMALGVSNTLLSGDAKSVREMIKILNLRESDASRLGIDSAQFSSLWQGATTDSVDASTLSSVHSRLRQMLN